MFSPAVVLVAVFALLVTARVAYSAASFSGQGTVPFDAIKVGKKDSDTIALNGTIKNTRKNKPVRVGDDLAVTGNLIFPDSRGGLIRADGNGNIVAIDDDLAVSGTIYTGGVITALDSSKAVTVDHELHVNQGLVVDGGSTVKDLNITGALTAGSYDLGKIIVDDASLTTRLGRFVDCVGTLAQFTSTVESDDYIFCFNTWIAGQSLSILSNLSDLQQEQIRLRREFDSAAPGSLPSAFEPLTHQAQ